MRIGRVSRVVLTAAVLVMSARCGGRDADEAAAPGIHDRGLALARMGRTVEALASLETSLEADPSDFEAQQTYWGLRKKQDEGAIDALRALEQAHPENPFYPRLLASLDPDPTTRLEAAHRAVRLSPDDARVVATLGDAFFDREMPDSAAAAYDRALELDAALGEAYVSRALLKEAGGDGAGAVAAYREGLERVVDPEARDGIVRRLFALLWGRGDFSGAETLARDEAGRIEDPWTLNDIAWTLADAKVDLDLAEGLAERAVERMTPETVGEGNPSIDARWAEVTARRYRGYFYDTLGYARRQAGDTDGAITALKKAVERVPYMDPDLLKRLADTLEEAGHPGDAIDALMTILSVSHDAEARRRLDALWVEAHGSREGLDEAVNSRRRERREPAVDFRLATMAGDTLSLSSLRGEVVLLTFWFPT